MNEFSWLPNSVLKQVPYLPEVQLVDTNDYGGCYWSPCEKYPRGFIEITSNYANDTKAYASTLAHEFRHHWQKFNFMPLVNYITWETVCNNYSYDDALGVYFNKNYTEKDAILFEYKLVKADYIELWIKHLLGWKI